MAADSHLLAAFDYLPGINPGLIDRARSGLVEQGPVALFTGVLGGVPYKLYATQAAGAGLGAGIILLATTFARLSRYCWSPAWPGWWGSNCSLTQAWGPNYASL